MTFRTFGNTEKGKHATENSEMIAFFKYLKLKHPELFSCATHVKNEGYRSYGQSYYQKKEGMLAGFSDIVIAGCPTFLCEMKSKNKGAKISESQKMVLESASKNGAFACVVYGFDNAVIALNEYIKIKNGMINE